MDEYKLDFKNIFDLLGIESLELEYLKDKLIKQLQKIKSQLVSQKYMQVLNIKAPVRDKELELKRLKEKLDKKINESCSKDEIEKLKSDIEKKQIEYNNDLDKVNSEEDKIRQQSNFKRDEIDKLIAQISKSNDIDEILNVLISIRISYLIEQYNKELELPNANIEEINDRLAQLQQIRQSIDSPDKLKNFIQKNHIVLMNTDFDNHDMTKYQYREKSVRLSKQRYQLYSSKKIIQDKDITRDALRPYVYVAEINDKPKKYFIDKNEHIYAYALGKFQYGSLLTLQGKPTYKSLIYDIIGVVRPDENGEFKSYHAVIYSIYTEPEFKKQVMLSPMLLRNAEANFGFLGYIKNHEHVTKGGFKSEIVFDEEISPGANNEIVTVLSYAANHEGIIVINGEKKKISLGKVFEEIDRSMDKAIEKGIYSRMDNFEGWTQGEE